jgi:hypothetical protein
MVLMKRRDFLRWATLRGMGAAFVARWSLPAQAPALRIGVVRHGNSGDTDDGVTLGLEEGVRSAELFHRAVEVDREGMTGSPSEEAARRLGDRGVTVLLATLSDESECVRLIRATATTPALVLLNAGASADTLRGADCARHAFHVAASDAMYRDAMSMAPRGGEGGAASATPAHAAMWHPTLEAFGAAQLNARFRARFHREMSPSAWAGWCAAKIAIEAFLRTGSHDASNLRAYLERDDVQFDGHKGAPLSFRAWDHQLRQPLYLVSDAASDSPSVVEVPPAGRPGTTTSRLRLDALGATATSTSCHWPST